MSRSILAVVASLAAFASACGGDEEPNASAESTPAATQGAQAANLDAIKAYLLEHTDRLVTSTEPPPRVRAVSDDCPSRA